MAGERFLLPGQNVSGQRVAMSFIKKCGYLVMLATFAIEEVVVGALSVR